MPRRSLRPKVKTKAPKKSHPGVATSLGTMLQQSKIGGALVKFNRDRKSKLKPLPKAGKSARRGPTISLPKFRLLRFFSPHLPGKIFWLRVGGIAFLLLVSFLVLRVLLVNFPRSPYDDPARETPAMTGDTVNILLNVYDPADRYSFADVVGVLSIDLKEDVPLHFINLSPEFGMLIDKKQVKIRSVLAQLEAANGYGMETLMTGVEGVLGVRVDRYMVFNKDKLTQYLVETGYSYLTTDAVRDAEAGEFQVGEVVQGERLINYLAADGAGIDAQMLRLRTFVSDLLTNQLSVAGFARMYVQLDQLSRLVETDMSKWELLRLGSNIVNRLTTTSISIGPKQAVEVESKLGGYLSPVVRAVDGEVRTLLVRTRVAREQARVEVYNATRTGGLASQMQRLLENQGTNVIRTANSPELSDKNKLYVANVEQFPANVSLISEMLRGDVQIINEDYPLNHTGDLVLVLGAGAD